MDGVSKDCNMFPIDRKQSEKLFSTGIIIMGLLINGLPTDYQTIRSVEEVNLDNCSQNECITFSELVSEHVRVTAEILNSNELTGTYTHSLSLYGVLPTEDGNEHLILRNSGNEVRSDISKEVINDNKLNLFEQTLSSITLRYAKSYDYNAAEAELNNNQVLIEHRITPINAQFSDSFTIKVTIEQDYPIYLPISTLFILPIILLFGLMPIIYGRYTRSRQIDEIISKNEEEATIDPTEFSLRMRSEILKNNS